MKEKAQQPQQERQLLGKASYKEGNLTVQDFRQEATVQRKIQALADRNQKQAPTNSNVPMQFASDVPGLSTYDTAQISNNAPAKYAYSLLTNQRQGFTAIKKDGGGVNAVTDSDNRVISAHQNIKTLREERNQFLQVAIGWLGNFEAQKYGYNGGHLLASSQGGPGTWGNMVPQDGPENKWGVWRKFEKENAKDAENDTANDYILEVELGYTGDSVLPTSWNAWVWQNKIQQDESKAYNWYSGDN